MEVKDYVKRSAKQLHRMTVRLAKQESVSPKDIREVLSAIRELSALEESLSPDAETPAVRVIFEGGEEDWAV